jgi:hypothetical protein
MEGLRLGLRVHLRTAVGLPKFSFFLYQSILERSHECSRISSFRQPQLYFRHGIVLLEDKPPTLSPLSKTTRGVLFWNGLSKKLETFLRVPLLHLVN